MFRYFIKLLCLFVFTGCSSQHCIQEGKKYYEEKNYEKALKSFNKCKDARKEAFFWIGNIYVQKGQNKKAIRNFNKAFGSESIDSARILLERAGANMDLGELSQSKQDLKYVLNKDPKNFKALYVLSKVYLKDNKPHKAIENIEKTIEIKPDSSELVKLHVLNGYASSNIGEHSKALKYYNKAIFLGHKEASTFYLKGYSLAELSQRKKAINAFSKAIDLDSNHLKSLISRGVNYWHLDSLNKACKDWERASKLGSEKAKDNYQKYCKDE